jgi:glyoxylase-like metal-dependent hydrolase (beta-lactamase superfamily II)
MTAEPEVVRAPNRSSFTLDGTRTFLVGRRRVAVIDPGPDVADHIRALVVRLEEAEEVRILLTHGHGDHAGAAPALALALGAPVLAGPGTSYEGPHQPLREGDVVPTDGGSLVTLEVPGHARGHLAFHWREPDALFVGDLVLGRGDTTWLGEYPGCVEDYLVSLEKVRALCPGVLYPAHGPPVTDVTRVLDAYRAHREERLARLARVRRERPEATPDELLALVYGDAFPPRLTRAARASMEVMLHHLEPRGS